MKESERVNKCRLPAHCLLATANTTTSRLFLYGNQDYNRFCSMTEASFSVPSTLLWNSANWSASFSLKPYLRIFHCTGFARFSSCLKPQGAEVADGRYNDIAKCKVNQPCLLGHSWVPITHWGEHQTAQSPHKMIKPGEDRGTRHSFSFPGKASPEPPLRYPCNLT